MSEVTKTIEFHQSNSTLAIFLSREPLAVCIKTIEAACIAVSKHGRIDLLVNGNTSLAHSLSRVLEDGLYQRVRVWDIPLGDKGNAWNLYIHKIWCDECIVFFIDGYVRLFEDSLERLYRTLHLNPDAFGGSGVPSIGRTANVLRLEMIKNGGFHGNLCCLTKNAICELKRRNIKIVLGMYRVDSLMGAFLCYGLDIASNKWNPKRTVVDSMASWDIDTKRWWRWSDCSAKIRQFERQLRGKMENAAVKNLFMVQNIDPERLPTDCYKLIEEWSTLDPSDYSRFVRMHPFAALAYWRYHGQKRTFNQAGLINLTFYKR